MVVLLKMSINKVLKSKRAKKIQKIKEKDNHNQIKINSKDQDQETERKRRNDIDLDHKSQTNRKTHRKRKGNIIGTKTIHKNVQREKSLHKQTKNTILKSTIHYKYSKIIKFNSHKNTLKRTGIGIQEKVRLFPSKEDEEDQGAALASEN